MNTELLVLAAVTVTLAPVAVSVPDAVPLDPTVTLPSESVVGDTLSCPVAVTPVPETGIVNVVFVAVEVTVRFPLTAPAVVGANETVKVALLPPLSVSGVVIPLTLNPVPVIPTWVTETLVVPVFVMVSDSLAVLPVFTLPKLRLVGFALSAPGVAPVPESDTVNVGFVAVESIVRVPLAPPFAVGVKVTLKVVLCPPFRVSGVLIPLKPKPVPVVLTWVTEILVVPVLVIVSDNVAVLPVFTVPKPRLVGFALSAPGVPPVPDSDTVNVGLVAVESIVRVPLALPLAVGVKVTVKVALCPPFRVSGVVIPLTPNPAPAIAT